MAGYFHPKWVPPSPMFRANIHEKRAPLNEAARSCDAIVVQRDRSSVHSADGEVHIGGQKFMWVPINRRSDAKAHDGTVRGCTKISAIKDNSLQDDLQPSVQTHVDKKIVRTSELVDASADEFTRDSGKIEAIGTEENSDGVKLQQTG